MSGDARLDELAARIELAQGSPTLLVVVAESDASLDETRQMLCELLRQQPMSVEDLGLCDLDTGPARWAELTNARKADAYVISAAPWGPFSGAAFAGLLNAEREFLRQLGGPVVLLVSRDTERLVRQKAPDFFTWAARAYELPSATELRAIAKRRGAAASQGVPAASEEPPIRFLHISDLHLRPQRVKRYDQDRVLRGLVEFLESSRERFPLDLIFVTGDLAHAGKPEELELVVALFQRILEITGVLPNHFFVVPGNHDVDRDVGRWLRRTLDRDEDAIAFFEEPEARRFHELKLAAYKAALSPLFGAERPLGLGVGKEAVEIVTVRGARIAVASFCTAYFAQGDDDHGKLWLGEANIDRAGDRITDEGANFAIALMHHPFEELHEMERDSVERRFERIFDLVLRGHMHQPKSRGIVSQRGGYVELAAPSAYQGSQWPNGCYLGEIRPRSGRLRIAPYAYATGADPWVLDTTVFPDNALDGYTHTFTIPEKRRTPSVLRRHLAKATEQAVAAAPEVLQRQLAKELGIEAPTSRASKAFAKRAAKAMSATAEDSANIQAMLGPDQMGRHIAMMALEISQQSEGDRISRKDPAFCEKVLTRLMAVSPNLLVPQMSGRLDHEKVLLYSLAAVIELLIDGPVFVQSPRSDGRLLDILVGEATDPSAERAFIAVKTVHTQKDDLFVDGLASLDRFAPAQGVDHVALVLLRKGIKGGEKPHIELAKTPAGKAVAILYLTIL